MTQQSEHHAETRIVFLHIPKTAGQSVHSELSRLVPQELISPIRVHTQSKGDERQMPDGFRLYSGHIDWVELGKVPAPKFAFTILRDPLERIASFYFYLSAQAEALTEEELAKPERTGMRIIRRASAEEYFFGGDASWQKFIRDHYDNVQTTYLATRRIRGWGKVRDVPPVNLLKRAFRNAAELDGVYSTKNLSRLEDNLTPIFTERPNIASTRVNVGPQTSGERWPELADRLGHRAAARLAAFAETDFRLFELLGLES